MNSDADKHLEAALELVGMKYIQEWLSRHNTPVKRGRRVGAASEQRRCQWLLRGGMEQCKNGKTDDSNFCGLHASKSSLIDDSESAASASASASDE